MSPDAAIERLKHFAIRLIDWNRRVSNLVSHNDEKRIVERHIAESVEPAAWLKASPATRWLDFGSGGGLPAIPLAIVGVGPRWTLVESRRMKTLFLRKTVETLELQNIDVVASRLETMANEVERGEPFDGFTSRATIALTPTLLLAARFVAPGGVAFLWKGSQRESEMKADPRWQDCWELDGLLGIGEGQTAVARFTRRA
ncbi:MAG TPA: 16S rRNA (guanine(527)-N(7))-methyltransferase RsmG [Candidatus Eisenbacteria bacterium]